MKTEFDFTVTEGGASADAHMTTRFTGYGADVTITIPEETLTDQRKFGCPNS